MGDGTESRSPRIFLQTLGHIGQRKSTGYPSEQTNVRDRQLWQHLVVIPQKATLALDAFFRMATIPRQCLPIVPLGPSLAERFAKEKFKRHRSVPSISEETHRVVGPVCSACRVWSFNGLEELEDSYCKNR